MIEDDLVIQARVEKDFVEEKEGDPFSGDGFLCKAKNYPLSKAMVNHDQERIKASEDREVCDKIAGDLLEGARCQGLDGGEQRYGGVHVGLVLLTRGTSLNVLADICRWLGQATRIPPQQAVGYLILYLVVTAYISMATSHHSYLSFTSVTY